MANSLRGSVLFINKVAPEQSRTLAQLAGYSQRPIRPIFLKNRQYRNPSNEELLTGAVVLEVDFDDEPALAGALAPYADDILTVTFSDDESAASLKYVMPYLAHLKLPLPETLEWATEKTKMRAKMRAYDKATSPKFVVVPDASAATVARIERTVGYPLIVKPSGLTSSMLITVCYYREELEQTLEQIMAAVATLSQGKPVEILVEQFMDDGIYYSIDAYVDARGRIKFLPPVYGKTGKDIGFDDFFGYMRVTPSQLSPEQVRACERAAATAIKAVNLRSTSCHVELMQTPRGWKIVELGPRIGGFRHELYEHAYGVNHALNDMLVRMGEAPVIQKRPKGYATCMVFYPRQEGRLKEIAGLDAIRQLGSLQRIMVHKQPGDLCLFAKHGGGHVFEVVLFNATRAGLLADVRRLEQALEIVVEPLRARVKPRPKSASL